MDWVDVPGHYVERLRALAGALPETSEERAWTGTRWVIRKKNFGHVFTLVDDGGDERTMLQFTADPEEGAVLLAIGHPFFAAWGGRLGMLLDDTTDWDEVGELLTESYCLLAPKKLVAALDRPEPPEPGSLRRV